ncbi:MAG: hypothetical protein PHC62_00670 [Candidatus Izemoplasmatales bacterium]|nr:hypothetical protein [Candidatus Izemoplasmatales bacterium]
MSDFTYEIDENSPVHVVDERGNVYLQMAKYKWNGKGDFKLGIRQFYSNAEGDRLGKGISFLTDNGPHDLCHALLEDGFGNPDEIVELAKSGRSDIMGAFAKYLADETDNTKIDEYIDAYKNSSTKEDEDDMYDPEEILE